MPRHFKSIFFVPIDVVLSAMAAVLIVLDHLMHLPFKMRRRQGKTIRVLRLIEGGEIASIYRKYGNFENYFNHLVPGATELVIGSIFFLDGNHFLLKLREDYWLAETLACKVLPCTSLMLFMWRNQYLIRRYGVDILHSNSIFLVGLAGLITARIAGIPFCASIHADYDKTSQMGGKIYPTAVRREFGKLAEKAVYKHANMILPTSGYLQKVTAAKGVSNEKMRIFYHCIKMHPYGDTYKIDIYRKFNIPENAKIVSSISRLDSLHYVDDVVTIALEVIKRNKEAIFLICGDGDGRKRSIERVENEGCGARIHFPGWVENKIVPFIRRASFANLSLYDGFGLLESCASGRPVFAYDVEWNPELIQDGITGFLIPEYDVQGLTERILYLMKRPEEASRIGNNARRFIEKNFSYEKISRDRASIYRELFYMGKDK